MSYYALFQGWLLLGKPPSCLCNPTSFSLSDDLGTLAGGLGCFPLDDEAYPPPSHWQWAPWVFLVCLDLVPVSQPAPKQCFTPQFFHYRCASTHFGENQLAPGSIGISPLTTAHPPIFQHRSVRTSTWFYPSFILAMVRSPGFGSINTDYRPFQTRFPFGSSIPALTYQYL